MEKSKLDLEFEEVCKTAQKLLMEKIAVATDALAEAVEIAEQYGIPFESRVSFLHQSYKPSTFGKWESVDANLFEKLTEIEFDRMHHYSRIGWQHSQVC